MIESSIVVKRKMSSNNESSPVPSTNKRIKSVGYVSARDHSKLAVQLANAVQENEIYQTTWMRKCSLTFYTRFTIRSFFVSLFLHQYWPDSEIPEFY